MTTQREIVLDTETTGLDPAEGHRIIEIGCLELVNHVPTGRTYHQYLNPERDVPAEAVAVHGLSTKFLADKPVFAQVGEDFLAFIEGAQLVIHNAEFDLKFLNAELSKHGYPSLGNFSVIDTLLMARQMFPGAPATLDALCRRFKIDNSGRELHGALLDSELLAEVYLELCGGRQRGLDLLALPTQGGGDLHGAAEEGERKSRPVRVFEISEEEASAHAALVGKLGDQALWHRNK